MTVRSYTSPAAFKEALEQRLRKTGLADLSRRRQLVVFDRMLARIVAAFGDAVVLKGGVALELRLERARATKDIDLRLTGSPEGLLARLRELGRLELGDFMAFEIEADPHHPEIQNDGMRYEGLRFRAECRLAGKIYGQRFGVDVAFGDPLVGDPDVVVADDVLAFAGVSPATLRLYPVETHIAEKLHAYTMPRSRPNSRVKDLPDLALLATAGERNAARLRAAIDTTFAFRTTHPVPGGLPDPPSEWARPYAALAAENSLSWSTLGDVTEAARAFLDPVLAAHAVVRWHPDRWRWE